MKCLALALCLIRVIDGDTFVLDENRIRLWGIDAPEIRAPGGKDAKDMLASLLRGPVECSPKGKSYNRVVALCTVHGVDIARIMVLSGHARDWPKYSGGYYANVSR